MRKPSTRTGVATVTTQGGSGPITSENYVQRAIEYARSHGGLSVIRRHSDQVQGYPATHARWKAWMEWKLAHSIRIRGALAAGIATVPAEWPEDFDPNADSSDKDFRFPSPPYVSLARRGEMARKLISLAEQIDKRNYDKRRPDQPLPPPESTDERVARLTREFRATPPLPLSDRARAAMGLEPAPREIPETWDFEDMAR